MLRQAEKLSTPKNIRLLFWHKEPQSVRNCRISDHTGVQTLIPGLRLPFPAPFFHSCQGGVSSQGATCSV